jgi:hypothetical protein
MPKISSLDADSVLYEKCHAQACGTATRSDVNFQIPSKDENFCVPLEMTLMPHIAASRVGYLAWPGETSRAGAFPIGYPSVGAVGVGLI